MKSESSETFGLGAKAKILIELVLQLATDTTGEPQSVDRIAKKIGFHRTYIHRLSKPLRECGMIMSIQGKRGGYLLNADPKDIDLMFLIKSSGDGSVIFPCLADPQSCPGKGRIACSKLEVWRVLNDRLVDLFTSITIEDIMNENVRRD